MPRDQWCPPTRVGKASTKPSVLPSIARQNCDFFFILRVFIISRVMRAAVPIPAVAAASVSHSAAVGGSVVGVVGLL